jgi:hypothetical protein
MGRRVAMERAVGFGAAVLIPAAALIACGKKQLACNDVMSLSDEIAKQRASFEYVDKSADPQKMCKNCKLFKPAGPDECGACTQVKGTINPDGNCKSWTAK